MRRKLPIRRKAGIICPTTFNPARDSGGYSEGIYSEESLGGARKRNQKARRRGGGLIISHFVSRDMCRVCCKVYIQHQELPNLFKMAQTAQPSQDSAKHRRPRPNGNMSKRHQRYLFSKNKNKKTVHPAKFQVHGTKLIIPGVRINRKRENNQR